MTEQTKRRPEDERKTQQGNLGQKEAKDESRSKDEMSHMGELTEDKNK